MGYITLGHRVTVHRTTCANARRVNPDRRVEVSWSAQNSETYPIKLRVRSDNRSGLLADVASAISKEGADILSADADTHGARAVLNFTVAVTGKTQLEAVMAAIKRVKKIQGVSRMSG
jgi:GTP pyrophosphokinase